MDTLEQLQKDYGNLVETVAMQQREIDKLKNIINFFVLADKYLFKRNIELFDGRNIKAGTGTGTSFGTASTQKLSVYGATPVVRAAAISAPNNQTSSYVQADAQSIVTAVNSIRTALKNFGITS